MVVNKSDGSIEIVGTMDVSGIKAGLSQVKLGLNNLKDNVNTAIGDLSGLSKSLAEIDSALFKIGVAAATTTIGLAGIGPATAPALARMKVSMFEISRTLAENLSPAFDAFADLLSDFGGWLKSPDGVVALGLFNDGLKGLVSVLEDVGVFGGSAFGALSKLGGKFEAFFDVKLGDTAQWVVDNFGLASLGAIAGLKVGGVPGAVVGAGLGFGVQSVAGHLQGRDTVLGGTVIGGAGLGVLDLLGGFLGGDFGVGFSDMLNTLVKGLSFSQVDVDFSKLYSSNNSGVSVGGGVKDVDELVSRISVWNSRYVNDVNGFRYLGYSR